MARVAAQKCRLRGEVENLENDTVRITCEGEKRNIDKFVEAIRSAKKPIEVYDVQIEYSEPTGRFKKFTIIMGDQSTEMFEGLITGLAHLRMMLDKQDGVINEIRPPNPTYTIPAA